jgi:hypothetical protein
MFDPIQVFGALKSWVKTYVFPTNAVPIPLPRDHLTSDVQASLNRADTEPQARSQQINEAIQNEANARQGQVSQLNGQIQSTNNTLATTNQNLSALNTQLQNTNADLQKTDKALWGDPSIPTQGVIKEFDDRIETLEQGGNGSGFVPNADQLAAMNSGATAAVVELAKSALQEETDPVYMKDKSDIALKTDIEDHDEDPDAHKEIIESLDRDILGLSESVSDINKIIPNQTSADNQLINNTILENALATIPTGLKPPIEIDTQSKLLTLHPEALLTSADVGLFYIIQNMDILASGRTGKAWANYKDGNSSNPVIWYKVFDQYYSADGVTITLTPTGQLQVAQALIQRIQDNEQAITVLETSVQNLEDNKVGNAHLTDSVAHSVLFAAKMDNTTPPVTPSDTTSLLNSIVSLMPNANTIVNALFASASADLFEDRPPAGSAQSFFVEIRRGTNVASVTIRTSTAAIWTRVIASITTTPVWQGAWLEGILSGTTSYGNLAQRSLVDISSFTTIHEMVQAMRSNSIRTRHISGTTWATLTDAPTGIGTIGAMLEIVSESSSATHTVVRITTMNTVGAIQYWRTASATGWWQPDWFVNATRSWVQPLLDAKRNVVPIPLIAGQDLNDPLLLSGVYTISTTVLPTLINTPPFDLGNTNCLLFVEKTIGDASPRNTFQRFVAVRADGVNANREFTRSSSANQLVWLDWQEVRTPTNTVSYLGTLTSADNTLASVIQAQPNNSYHFTINTTTLTDTPVSTASAYVEVLTTRQTNRKIIRVTDTILPNQPTYYRNLNSTTWAWMGDWTINAAIALTTGQDLNNVSTVGFYSVGMTVGNTLLNLPIPTLPAGFTLIVEQVSAVAINQTLTIGGVINRTFKRTSNSLTAWTPWVEIATQVWVDEAYQRKLPPPPATGTVALKSVDGVLQWIPD